MLGKFGYKSKAAAAAVAVAVISPFIYQKHSDQK